MKTSLMIDDHLFREAQKEARRRNKTLSETISHWARVGRETLKKDLRQKNVNRADFTNTVDLGGPSTMDVNARRNWMDLV